ncbi:MAG: multiheme c-type cytochrome [Limisphaerales bacterium]
MNRAIRHLLRRPSFLLLGVVLASAAPAQEVQHLSTNLPGGMPGLPIITGIASVTNGVKVTWDGPSGYYQLFESPTTNKPVWRALTRQTDLLRNAIVPSRYSNAFFRVAGPPPQYAEAETCLACHAPILNTEIHTLHAVAFSNASFAACGGQTNSSCLACHTVGFDLPTGFVSAARTPPLANVQCENCHGPAGPHAANPADPLVRPRVEVAATVCGGCHSDPRHPTYEEWTNSAHAQVVEDMNPASRIDACGRCHSGTVRLSLLENMALPAGDADIGIVCATCHDPHQTNAYPAQLRNPVASTNDYFMPANGTFASSYNPEINICAQCHNHAGASWTNNACEPHHSLQYNMLLGSVGELSSGLAPYQPATHALAITNQCVGCHMQTSSFVSDSQPAVTGHSFKVETYTLCLNCHSLPEQTVAFTTSDVSNQVQQVKSLLDDWATNKAPAALAKYGVLAWEYTTPGGLSSGGPGPNAAEQALIPENIRKARFNLYLVRNDGSFGVHNPHFTINLLQTAAGWVEGELDP